jgi:predicted transcriptional regulator
MPVDPAPLNSVADLVLSDARAMRALTDPLRLTLFDLVRREGPIISNALAHRIDQDQETVDDHLRELASVGFVEEAAGDEREVRWTTEAKGIYFEIPDEAEGQRAARELSKMMMTKYAELPASWADGEEPKLGLEWLERMLEPFTTRSAAERPVDVTPVRILCFFMPEAERDI